MRRSVNSRMATPSSTAAATMVPSGVSNRVVTRGRAWLVRALAAALVAGAALSREPFRLDRA